MVKGMIEFRNETNAHSGLTRSRTREGVRSGGEQGVLRTRPVKRGVVVGTPVEEGLTALDKAQ